MLYGLVQIGWPNCRKPATGGSCMHAVGRATNKKYLVLGHEHLGNVIRPHSLWARPWWKLATVMLARQL